MMFEYGGLIAGNSRVKGDNMKTIISIGMMKKVGMGDKNMFKGLKERLECWFDRSNRCVVCHKRLKYGEEIWTSWDGKTHRNYCLACKKEKGL